MYAQVISSLNNKSISDQKTNNTSMKYAMQDVLTWKSLTTAKYKVRSNQEWLLINKGVASDEVMNNGM